MSDVTSVILFDAAAEYANESSVASIRPDLRMAFVAGAEWQWQRVGAKDAEIARLREVLDQCEDYFDNRADADCDQDGFQPNREMVLLSVVRAALAGGYDGPL